MFETVQNTLAAGEASAPAGIPAAARTIGVAAIARRAFEHSDLRTESDQVLARLKACERDAGALMDLASILYSRGQAADGDQVQRDALAIRRSFATVHGDGTGPRILAFMAPGGFMANTPVDFLLSGSDAVLWQVYLDAADTELPALPPHDAALLAVGEATGHRPLLARFETLARAYPGRILNGRPERIAALTRDGVAAMFADIEGVLCPSTVRAERPALARVANGAPLSDLGAGLRWPLVLRPAGGHAGAGMRRLSGPGALADALAECPGQAFFAAPFINYRDRNGLFTKSRVVLVDGRPYPVHLAQSEDWIVHYLSSGMLTHAGRRAVEAAWFEDFDTGFARRHAGALAAMQERIGLDYWGIDCAELADGRLLVFEADTAMIVHDMDDRELFSYKCRPMARLFAAFQALAVADSSQASGGGA